MSERSESLEARVREALQSVKFPGMSRDIVSFGFLRDLKVDGRNVTVHLEMATKNESAAQSVRQAAQEAVAAVPDVDRVEVRLELKEPPRPEAAAQQATSRDAGLIPDVDRVVAVASGKGGVGKSTVAANLAIALSQLGHRVGLLDADIYGPSMPIMFGIKDKPVVEENRLQPFDRHGVKVMSLGFVLDVDTPVIWRGPMVMKAIEQLLGDVDWGKLDYMIVDLPPGTGDAQLTLSQKVPLSGAVVVTTPQDVALIDARKGLAMFEKVSVPVVGIVENMAAFVCPHCGEKTSIFKEGGGERTAEELGTQFLGSVPLDPAIVEGGDSGTPIVVSQPEGPHARAFKQIAEQVAAQLEARGKRPKLSIVQ